MGMNSTPLRHRRMVWFWVFLISTVPIAICMVAAVRSHGEYLVELAVAILGGLFGTAFSLIADMRRMLAS